jgi:hypothetical protein
VEGEEVSREDGDIYEDQFEQVCHALRYQVIRPQVGNQRAWDRMVNGNRVQVKKRGIDLSKPNNIRLITSRSSSECVYNIDSVDFFAIFWDHDWYIVPASRIADKLGNIKNGIYMPSVSEFKRRWDVLDGERVTFSCQKSFSF